MAYDHDGRRTLTFTETLDLPVRDLEACEVIRDELVAIENEGWMKGQE